MATSFFIGAVSGALGFKHVGYLSTVPLAFALVMLASVPVVDDLVVMMRRWTRGSHSPHNEFVTTIAVLSHSQ